VWIRSWVLTCCRSYTTRSSGELCAIAAPFAVLCSGRLYRYCGNDVLTWTGVCAVC
jgi:hypothetical protein